VNDDRFRAGSDVTSGKSDGLDGMRRQISNFTRISDPHEAPVSREVSLDTTRVDVNEAVSIIVREAERLGHVSAVALP
jgi:hypothetical protein